MISMHDTHALPLPAVAHQLAACGDTAGTLACGAHLLPPRLPLPRPPLAELRERDRMASDETPVYFDFSSFAYEHDERYVCTASVNHLPCALWVSALGYTQTQDEACQCLCDWKAKRHHTSTRGPDRLLSHQDLGKD